jgi:hypothetical protein
MRIAPSRRTLILPTALAAAMSAALLLAAGPPGPARPAPELQAVPRGAWMFAHLRLGEVWNSPLGRRVREDIRKSNPEALARLDRLLGVPAAGVASLTAVWPTTAGPRIDTSFALVVNLARPAAKKDLLATLASDGEDREGLPDGFYRLPGTDSGTFHLAGDRRVVLFTDARARTSLFELLLQRGPGGLDDALAAAQGHDLTIGLRPAVLLPGPGDEPVGPRERELILPLLEADTVTVTADFGETLRASLTARYPGTGPAAKAERVAQVNRQIIKETLTAGLKRLRGEMPAYRAALEVLAPAAGAARIEPEGTTLRVFAEAPAAPLLTAAADLFAYDRSTTARMQSQNNLKQIALAMLNYESAYGEFPPAAICSKQGKPLLSWRVAILPYIGQDNLYQQFRLNEPWDSPYNKRLAEVAVKLYLLPGAKDAMPGPGQPVTTHYRVFVGGGAAFELRKASRIADFADGLSNTLMAVEAAEAVPWTKPDELTYDPKKPLPKTADLFDGGFNAVFCDGSVRFIRKTVKEPTLRAMITRAGGEVYSIDDP